MADEAASAVVRLLEGEPLVQVAAQLTDEDELCFRLVCKAFKRSSSVPKAKRRSAFMRSVALAEFAFEELPGFRDETAHAATLAAGVGNVEVLAWLHERGCPMTPRTCSAAARGGHLEVLRWAREHGCPWNADTCTSAAGGGHLEALRWAHQAGCPWNPHVCFAAHANGHLDVLRWASENGCSFSGFWFDAEYAPPSLLRRSARICWR